MNDATSGTHAESDAVEPQRKTDAYPGEPDVDEDEADERELGDVAAALDEETQ